MAKVRFNRKYFSYPYITLSIIFVVVPIFIMLSYAFTTYGGDFTLDNFLMFFTLSSTPKVMLSSFWLAILTSVICLALAYPLALVLASSKYNKNKILILLFILPMWINFLLRTLAMLNLLSIFRIENGFTAVVIGMVYDFFPFMLLPLYTVLVNMDKSVLEAGSDLGASPFRRFMRVTLPLSVPGIISGVLMTFMPSISTFAIADILGDANVYLFGKSIDAYFAAHESWNVGSAFAFIMLLLIAASMFVANKFTKQTQNDRGGSVL